MISIRNPPEFYLVASCRDLRRNDHLGPSVVSVVECLSSEELPGVPVAFSMIQRFVVKKRENNDLGHWIHVNLNDEHVALIKATTLAEIQRFLMKLCINCYVPFETCTCRCRWLPRRSWEVSDIRDQILVENENYFQSILHRRRNTSLLAVPIVQQNLLNGTTIDNTLSGRRSSNSSQDSSEGFCEPIQEPMPDNDEDKDGYDSQSRDSDFETGFRRTTPIVISEETEPRPVNLTNFNRRLFRDDISGAEGRFQSKKTYEQILTQPDVYEPLAKLTEDVMTLVYQIKNSESVVSLGIAVGAFVRSATGRSTSYLIKDLVKMTIDELGYVFSGPRLQGDNEKKHWIDTLDEFYSNYGRIKDSFLGEKLKKVFNHLVAHVVYHRLGVEMDPVLFAQIEKNQIRPNLVSCLTFADALASLIVFLLKQGRQAMLCGDVTYFFVSADSTSEWMHTVRKLKMETEFMGNPGAIGRTLHEYLYELHNTIEQGQTLMKFMKPSTPEGRIVSSLNIDLIAIENRYLSITCAQSMRRQPLGVLIYGDPGVGKTAISTMITKFDALRRSRPLGNEYVFQMPTNSDHVDGFRSHVHTIIIDDAAEHAPNKIPGVDPTLALILRIINNMPFVPPQAGLEEKGKTPMFPDLVVITSNKEDLNLPIYYPASYAPMRRLKVHVTPEVKPEYRKAGGTDIDSDKADLNVEFPNYWNFIIKVPRKHTDSKTGHFQEVARFSEVKEFLAWFGTQSDIHYRQQQAFLNSQAIHTDTKLCGKCKMPEEICVCVLVGDQEPETRLLCQEDTVQGNIQMMRIEEVDESSSGESDDNGMPPGPNPPDNDLYKQFHKGTTRNTRSCGSGVFISTAPPVTIDQRLHKLFANTKEEYLRPWRKEVHSRVPITYTMRLSNMFVAKFGDVEKYRKWLSAYAFGELPVLLSLGWTSDEILKDFNDYNVYMEEKDEIEFLDYMSNEVTTSMRKMANIEEESLLDCIIRFLIDLYFAYTICRMTCRYLGKFRIVRKNFVRYLRPWLTRSSNQVYFAKKLGKTIDNSVRGKDVRISLMLKGVALISTLALGYVMMTRIQKPKVVVVEKLSPRRRNSRQKAFKRYFCDDNDDEISSICRDPSELSDDTPSEPENEYTQALQALQDRGEMPVYRQGDQRFNPWNRPERHVTEVDFCSRRIKNNDDYARKLSRNVLKFHAFGRDEGGVFRNVGCMIAISEDRFIMNSHTVPRDDPLKMRIFYSSYSKDQLGGFTDLELRQCQIERFPLRDLCVIKTQSLNHQFGDISRNLITSTFDGSCNGYILTRKPDGSLYKIRVLGIEKTRMVNVQNNLNTLAYTGFVSEDCPLTEDGDCGSPLVGETSFGPVLLGFHSVLASQNRQVWAVPFTIEDCKKIVPVMDIVGGELQLRRTDLHEAKVSYSDFHSDVPLMYHGDLHGFRARPKHHVFNTVLHEQVVGKTIGGFMVEDKFVGPWMDNWRPQQVSLKEFLHPVQFMDEVLLDKCSDVFFEHIVNGLPKEEWDLIHVYPYRVAVNGMPSMAYVDAIKKSTSMGFPWKKTKRAFLESDEDDFWPEGQKFSGEIETLIENWISQMEAGERLHAIWSANLKDEPVKRKKYEAHKTRVFFSGPAPLLIIIRMYFMGFVRVVNRNNYLFCTAVGMNPHSLQWEELYKYLSRFGTERCIAGDYAFFDKKMKSLLIKKAMFWIIRVCEHSGKFTEEELRVMRVIAHEISNPTVDYFGMIITLLAGEVSGHQITTILNCIINVFYLMYVFGKLGYDVEKFFLKVVAITLGDDHVVSVSPDCPLFTHTAIQTVMRDMGVDYTMADKEAESKPYIHLDDCTFLKRTFTYSTMFGVHVAPLDKESIFKMMTVQVASKAVTKSEQLAQACVSASMEAFFHGREFFEAVEELLNKVELSEEYEIAFRQYPRFTWDQNVSRFWATDKGMYNKTCIESPDVGYTVSAQDRNHNAPVPHIDCTAQKLVLHELVRVDEVQNHARAFPEIRIYGSVELDTKKDYTEKKDEPPSFPDNHRFSKETSDSPEQLNAQEGENLSKDTVREQTVFANEPEGENLQAHQVLNPKINRQVLQADLGSYLSRPTKILSYTWAENEPGGVLMSFQPFRLFFSHPYISSKIDSYGLMRCNLHLKFTINASQFYYGSLGAFFSPRTNDYIDWDNINGGQILLSQQPHVWLNPQSTSVCDMDLPFICPTNFISTLSATGLGNLGTIRLAQYASLRSANGVTTAGVNVVVYAWATNVELTAPTFRAAMQSKKEYVPDGQISGPASVVSNVARKLSDVPVVGPFARATDVVASALGSVASYFGYTNVPNISDVQPVKSVAFHTLASSTISEPINKLSLQPKQETALFSRYDAQDQDPLLISSLVGRESFLAGSLWATTDLEDTILFTASVTPSLGVWQNDNAGKKEVYYRTPMGLVASSFQYWTGDIIFRFKIIKTQYHRGRLNILWDTGAMLPTHMPLSGHPSVMNIIVDLDDTDEVEVRVPYMNALPFLKAANINSWSNGHSPSFSSTPSNGIIQLRVVNRLTAPEASSDVDVLVFVRGAENLKFAGPVSYATRTTVAQVQSKKEYIFNSHTSDSWESSIATCAGENIVSMRELFHRQNLCYTFTRRAAPGIVCELHEILPLPLLPPMPGFHAWGHITVNKLLTTGTAKYFPTRISPLMLFTYCFAGYRGSVNYTFNVRSEKDGRDVPSSRVTACRNFKNISSATTKTISRELERSHSQMGLDYSQELYDECEGAALTNQMTQSGLSVNLPYYHAENFKTPNLDGTGSDGTGLLFQWARYSDGTVNNNSVVDIYHGSGPDYDVFYFVNVPTIYRNYSVTAV